MTIQIAMAEEGIRPDLQVVTQFGPVVAEADYYEAVLEAIRQADNQYPQANWVIWVQVSHSYDKWTARGTAALLEPATQP